MTGRARLDRARRLLDTAPPAPVRGQLDASQAASRTGWPLPARPWNGLTVLDACCCAGGAAMGWYLAGWDVVGVDLDEQPNYPFPFVRGDAIEYIRAHGHEYDMVHASWPCQYGAAITKGTNRHLRETYPDLIGPGREAMLAAGRPYVIENPDARPDVTLCGTMFGLPILRHRKFEAEGWFPLALPHTRHRGRVRGHRHGKHYDGPYVAAYGRGGGKATVAEMQVAMQITWTDVRHELTEAIPPAYTRFLAEQAAEQILAERMTVAA
ncbi:DNA methylase [Streptomyces sp. NBC_00572]|uniref:DNA methylase n=1 Tax=Streptomyces sp. NBC_00572 TaxID=2903664 RepID=UPI00225508CC|nr:DNA methylase [Streptomyces sp. NBC_00572]MCX4987151.1 DNA methylase [Streptomyces sp. NBC_00572]